MRRIVLRSLACILLATFLPSPRTASTGGVAVYPNLKTVPPALAPRGSEMDTQIVDGRPHTVLRLSNTVWNAGEGALELIRGPDIPGSNPRRAKAFQQVYDAAGEPAGDPIDVGLFEFHVSHNHWHFGEFSRYELWTRQEYERFVSSGGTDGKRLFDHGKVSFCIIDFRQHDLGASNASRAPVYRVPSGSDGYHNCNVQIQGLSKGFEDLYSYTLPDQWIDLGEQVKGKRPLQSSEYVLRSVADPANLIFESNGKADPARESDADNGAITRFTVAKCSAKYTYGTGSNDPRCDIRLDWKKRRAD